MCKHCPTKLLELQNVALIINNALQEEHASHLPKGIKSGSSSTLNWGASTSHQASTSKKLSKDPNFVLEEEHNCHHAEGTSKEEEADCNLLEGLPPEYHQYTKVFGEEEFNKLPLHRHYDIGVKPVEEGHLNYLLYSMTNAKSSTLKDWLRDELKTGKILPSKSSISSLVMFGPTKDGSCQLVVDYCCLNNQTKKNVYPLPHPDNLMAQLCGAKVFTKLNLRWGYYNVCVKEGNKWKTAFRTKYGLY
ncbi:Retrotransposable element Tf2 protein [Rhizoctonia solani]|uniref:Retrotransposable element Tf2 protein n=1 Tax=Rhizoctonia solani TaxID=456999 RepID=A0A8H8SVB3_9AGAM|nr:Retrotransposable element Tf2 protein [Rhizoctonia solani]QRW17968.1 Retrotransposable element Tf2 protein [Rhizoctonia solani]